MASKATGALVAKFDSHIVTIKKTISNKGVMPWFIEELS